MLPIRLALREEAEFLTSVLPVRLFLFVFRSLLVWFFFLGPGLHSRFRGPLSSDPRVPALLSRLSYFQMLRPGSIVAIDCEFVCVENDETRPLDASDPSSALIVVKPARLLLARVSLVMDPFSPAVEPPLLLDDYIIPSEPVVDYLTKFSGLHPGTSNETCGLFSCLPFLFASGSFLL